MNPSTRTAAAPTFDFDYYRFNGKGNRPVRVSSPEQADFMRSRYSIEESLVNTVCERVAAWGSRRGIGVIPKSPFPSNQDGKVWLEFRFGGLTL